MKTTLNKEELKELNACEEEYQTFVNSHGDKTVTLSQALSSNGWDDIWWYISEVYNEFSHEQKKQLHLLGCDWAEQVISNFESEFPDDNRPRLAIEAKRKWIGGEISDDELSAAESAAESAARSAWSAWPAARAARAARDAAGSAARSAAWAAAWAAGSEHMDKYTSQLRDLFISWESNPTQ